jgi:hypothetical protein
MAEIEFAAIESLDKQQMTEALATAQLRHLPHFQEKDSNLKKK